MSTPEGAGNVNTGSQPSTPAQTGDNWEWPTKNTTLSGYHYTATHHALDVGAKTGDPILAPVNGKIIKTAYDPNGYGNYVVIQDAEGKYNIILAHLSKIYGKVGQAVNPGNVIGLAGSTGNSTGPHLHFEIRTAGGGGWINPYSIFGNNPSPGQIIGSTPSGDNTPSSGQNVTVDVGTGSTGTGSTGTTGGGISIPGLLNIQIPSLRDQISGLLSGINWTGVGIAITGLVVIGVGLYGLVQQEAGGIIGKTIGRAISEAKQ